MGKVIGIDLGTTFSCAAYINKNGQPEIIPNTEGELTTPSSVLFEDGNVIVGQEAKDQSFSNPKNYEQFVKRHMGERDYLFTINNSEKFTPESISAIILTKIKNDAEEYLGDKVDGAIVTVPAYFNEAQKKATMDAGNIAGLNIIGVINEPTAAALSFGIAKGDSNERTIMVYDLGGGTFDVTIMRFTKDNIEVLGIAGDRKLGGYDFDEKIVEDVIKDAKAQGIDIESDILARQDLQIKAEKAKKSLSSKTKTSIALNVNGCPYKYVITRDDFLDMVEPLLYKTLGSIENVCDEAGVEYDDLDKILLVGGSTKMPIVKEFILEETGINPSSEVHADEAVAIGAAYYAVDIMKKRQSEEKRKNETMEVDIPETTNNYTFTDVTSHGIGIVIQDENKKDCNSVILPKNSKVPAEKTQYYNTTVPYQGAVKINVTQGEESDLRYVTIIGTANIKIVPRKQIVDVKVTISCDENSIIHVTVFDMDLNRDLGEIRIDRVSNLTDEQIKQDRIRISKLDISGE